MRTLLVLALTLVGAMALPGGAEARRAVRGHAYHPNYYQPRSYYQPNPYYSRERIVCEERAQAEDPTGLYAGYPCWAREAFGRSGGGGRR
jgi:hypothetical protein